MGWRWRGEQGSSGREAGCARASRAYMLKTLGKEANFLALPKLFAHNIGETQILKRRYRHNVVGRRPRYQNYLRRGRRGEFTDGQKNRDGPGGRERGLDGGQKEGGFRAGEVWGGA